jgi:hypothetical protein
MGKTEVPTVGNDPLLGMALTPGQGADEDGLVFRDGLWHITHSDGEMVPFNVYRHSKTVRVDALAEGEYILSTWFQGPAEVVAVSKKSIRERSVYSGESHRLMKWEWDGRAGENIAVTTRRVPAAVMAHALVLMKDKEAPTVSAS